jgi:ferredoxin
MKFYKKYKTWRILNMNIELYYFSGTGNSLYISKKISEKLDVKLISIPSIMNKSAIESEAEVIGIVFPVYFAINNDGIPFLVKRFINKFENLQSKYIFTATTSDNMSWETLKNFEKLINKKKGILSMGINFNMSNKSVLKDIISKFKNNSKKEENINVKNLYKDDLNEKIEKLVESIKNKKNEKIKSVNIFIKIFIYPLLVITKFVFWLRYKNLSKKISFNFEKLVHLADKSFKTSNSCNGCGICEKVCPVDNIKLVHMKPTWLHKCENCYACFQWCPQKAISGDIVKYKEDYHHPEIKVIELFDNL